MFSERPDRVCAVIGTGPSLTLEQILLLDEYGIPKFGANRAYEFNLHVHYSCNWQFYDVYWKELKNRFCHWWTCQQIAADKYGIRYIAEKWMDGLCRDPDYISPHHGSGPALINLAYHYGARKIILIGWDMRYPGRKDNRTYTLPRHYFGEYDPALQHWPRTGPNGELEGLIDEMKTINPADYGLDIVNCTPGSALHHFRMGDLRHEISLGERTARSTL